MVSKILIAGGSGLLGNRLTALLLKHNYEVGWLSRTESKQRNVRMFTWDPEKKQIDENAISWADAIIHLAGAGIADKRWTKKRKQEIIRSRTQSIQLIKDTMLRIPHNVQCVLAASAVGIYGDRPSEQLFETSAPGKGFLSTSVLEWEQAGNSFSETGVRLVTMRIGIVLSGRGGALPELKKTILFGIAPVLGSGKQFYPWIHIDDVAAFFMYALEHNSVNGTYNVCAGSTTQKNIMRSIRKVYNPFSLLIPVPAFALRIILGEMASTVLVSQDVSNKKLLQTGYVLQWTDVSAALHQIKNNHT